ncbi:PREDICTED: DNA ligase 1-like [Rhagoletis zephyria]|uniref:DNA ligase 1-like n=1 Tax=Rhagoletis zephyria TaxID=28612 RepID=UPI0008112CE4|nr:PREDICTED: DNA ligase 1-like [Rhagoletis zephyria]
MFLFKPSTDNSDTYDPAKATSKYNAVKDAVWKSGEKVPFLALAKTFAAIEEHSGRLKSIEIMSNYFCSVMHLSPDDLVKSVYMCLNKVCPDYENIELGIGPGILHKALAESTGKTLAQVKKDIASLGDIGLYAEKSKSNQKLLVKPKPLTVSAVFDAFKTIAMMTGNQVQSKKVDKIKSLITSSSPIESRFIMRSLAGKMRIGLGEKSLLQALTQAYLIFKDESNAKLVGSDKFKEKLAKKSLLLQTAYCECPNYDKIIPTLMEHGLENLSKFCFLTPGIPLKPMLAHPTKGVQDVLERLEGAKFTCEYKYDGERAQIHLNDDKDTYIYSRNQENNTEKYPDIVKLIHEIVSPNVTNFILDCEAVAFDVSTKQILPFQVLSTRKRKNVDESEITVRVCLFAFDLLYLNSESLVTKDLSERRELLRQSFNEVEGKFMLATSKDLSDVDAIQEFLEESIKSKCEGLMIKTLHDDATYEIAKRSRKWLKLKKDYLEGVGDTLDLVPIGAYLGKGKRTGVYGGFLLACYDEESEEFQSICKIGTGFTDEDLSSLSASLKESLVAKPKSYFLFDDSLNPDVWFEPSQVWEVKCADLSISPVHRAGVGLLDDTKGISLRFPRFIKLREDKKPEDATTASQVVDMYRNQESVKSGDGGAEAAGTAGSKEDENDYY